MQTITSDDIARIAAWTESREGGITPVHGAHDEAKLAELIADMNENGWRGAPLVVDVEQALTGSHRYWAAIATYTEIPRIQVEDLCGLYGIDWEDHLAAYPDYLDAYIALADVLPADVVDYLGLDLH